MEGILPPLSYLLPYSVASLRFPTFSIFLTAFLPFSRFPSFLDRASLCFDGLSLFRTLFLLPFFPVFRVFVLVVLVGLVVVVRVRFRACCSVPTVVTSLRSVLLLVAGSCWAFRRSLCIYILYSYLVLFFLGREGSCGLSCFGVGSFKRVLSVFRSFWCAGVNLALGRRLSVVLVLSRWCLLVVVQVVAGSEVSTL